MFKGAIWALDGEGICSLRIKGSFYIIDASQPPVLKRIIHPFHKHSSALETRLQQEA